MAAASDNTAISVALQTAAATLPRPPSSPRRKHRPSRSSVRRSVVEFVSTNGSSDDDDDQCGAERPMPVSPAARPLVRNFSVPDPAELQRWKADMRTSHVRNEHYDDSPPISPRTYHSSEAESNDENTPGGEDPHTGGHIEVCTKYPTNDHPRSRKISAPAQSGKTFAPTEDDFKRGCKPTRHHERSKSASAATADHTRGAGVKSHMWESTYAASTSRPGVSRGNSVSHLVQTNRTFLDTENGPLRESNIHVVRARQRYGDGVQSYSFSARAPARVVGAPPIDEIDLRENPRQSLRADSWRSQQVAMSAPKYCKNSVREKAHSIAGFGQKTITIDALPYMKGGVRMLKQGRNGRRQMRWIFLTTDQTAIFWNGGIMSTSTVFIRLKDIEKVIPRTNLHLRHRDRGRSYSFALKFPERNTYNRTVLHLLVHSERDLTLWVSGLTHLVECAKNGHELCDIMDVQVEIDARRENANLPSTQSARQDVKRSGPPLHPTAPHSSDVKQASVSTSTNSMRIPPCNLPMEAPGSQPSIYPRKRKGTHVVLTSIASAQK